MASGSDQMRSGEVRPRQQQRHHVLQLIAKAEGAAQLCACARPETAAHVLIDEPPIDHTSNESSA
jgi:hypothetical protein